ncbi:hypothetical protein [Enterococcus sp. AD013-P3]|uniref:hypothetical protein n=1 Tax=Enterococcus sp. AD013-P3 TaxID=3411036 RepID=UPI003B957894
MMIRVEIQPSVNRYVGNEVKKFIAWINSTMYFPKNVSITVTGSKFVYNTITTEKVLGTFFGPYSDSTLLPVIKIATGDFFNSVDIRGIEKAKLELFELISHEIVHFTQWLNDDPYDEAKTEIEASNIAEQYSRL